MTVSLPRGNPPFHCGDCPFFWPLTQSENYCLEHTSAKGGWLPVNRTTLACAHHPEFREMLLLDTAESPIPKDGVPIVPNNGPFDLVSAIQEVEKCGGWRNPRFFAYRYGFLGERIEVTLNMGVLVKVDSDSKRPPPPMLTFSDLKAVDWRVQVWCPREPRHDGVA